METYGYYGPSLVTQPDKPACQCGRHGFDPWIRKIPWRRKWQHTPVFLPGESIGQRRLSSYSAWVCKRVGLGLVTKQQIRLLVFVTSIRLLVFANIKSLYCTLGTNKMLYINYISILKKFKSLHREIWWLSIWVELKEHSHWQTLEQDLVWIFFSPSHNIWADFLLM